MKTNKSEDFSVTDIGGCNEAKRERWNDLRRHQEWFVKAAEFWSSDYCRTGSPFSQDMMNQMYEALNGIDLLYDFLERPGVMIAPRLKLPVPDRFNQ